MDRGAATSVGAVLTFLNLTALEEEAVAKGKPLRMSFGKDDADYKALWCYETPLYRLDLAAVHPAILGPRAEMFGRRVGRKLKRMTGRA